MFNSKKKLLAGDFNVYAVYDKISKHYLRLYFNSTDKDFIRLYLPEVILSTPLRDLEVYCIGTINDVTGIIKSSPKRKIDLRCYTFPHSRLSPKGDDVTHEQIEESINQTKNELKTVFSTEVKNTEKNKEE